LTELYLSDKRGRALFLVFRLYALGSMLHAPCYFWHKVCLIFSIVIGIL
jgi:hypothetical protein